MSKKILIVDDSKTARMIIGKIVVKFGHEVVGEADNGQIGFEKYKELKPDLVFSDIEMPVVDGYEMVSKIIEFDENAKIAMITSVVNAQIIQKIMAIGAIDAIKKPINDRKIEKVLNKVK